MVGNNIYYNDYVLGYIGLSDIPYKYWDSSVIAYALKKEDLQKALVVLQKALEAYPGKTI